ncbi:MAG: hypothetical protein KAG66_02060 [Methylococcales bacterium]|nr:hypothetical protein [Methylococcales bacterium]
MPRAIRLQTNFNSGEMDPRLANRTDVKQFYQGAATALNVVSSPQGGIQRRPGLRYLDTLNGTSRLAAFSFNTEQTYCVVFTNNNIEIFMEGVSQANVTTTYTAAQLAGMNWTQSADTMILVHPDHQPATLVRGASNTSWTLANITLTNVPTHDFGSGTAEAVWSSTKGWPVSCTFFESRLWFGGSKSRPQSLWGSVTNDFYNFDLGTSLADESIYITLDTDQVNAVTAVYAGRHLQVFTTGGEFYMPDSPLTPEKSAVKRQTRYGSSSIRPVMIDGATLYLDRTGKAVREFVYTYSEDAYTSSSTSILASHLLNTPLDMDVSRGTSKDSANYIYIVNLDGTVAVYNTLRGHEVSGWTQWVTDGVVESVAVVVDEVYFAVKRTINGSTVYYLEATDPDRYTDSCKLVTNSPASATVSGLAHLNGEVCRVKADGSVMPNATVASGSITLSRTASSIEVGLDYEVKVKTMPLNIDFQNGPILTRKKRIIRVIVNLYQSLGIYVDGTLLPDRTLGENVLDTTPTPYTGLKEVFMLGWTDLAQIEITQVDPVPMLLIGLSLEVEA